MEKVNALSNEQFFTVLNVHQIYLDPDPAVQKAAEARYRAEAKRRDSKNGEKRFNELLDEVRSFTGRPSISVERFGVELELKKDGMPKNVVENFAAILRTDEMYKGLKYNSMSSTLYMGSEKFNDTHLAIITSTIETKYGIYSKDKLNQAIELVANERVYHPVRDMIEGIRWDGKSRIYTMLHRWLKCEDTDYTRECSRLIFAGGINRIYNPGCKFDDVIVLIGTKQGEGKSSFVQWLAVDEEYFTEVITIDDQKGAEAIEGVWIAEFSELDAFRKAKEATAVKSYITRRFDHYRKPYARFVSDIPRQCIFIGTTNTEEFIADKTGGRRFYPVKVQSNGYELHDHKAEIIEEIKQCWAEALHLYREGKLPAVANRDLSEDFREAQKEATEEDWRAGVIEQWLNVKTVGSFVCTRMIWVDALHMDANQKMLPIETRAISEIMSKMPGWKRVGPKRFPDWGVQKAWGKYNVVTD